MVNIQFNRKGYTDSQLLPLYSGMLKSRMIEEKMLVLLRQNNISKWFSGIGQEAVSTGVTLALNRQEWIFPTHRNLGVFINRGIPFQKLFAQWKGNRSGFTKGRDRSFHFGSHEFCIGSMISHMAAQLSVADGVGLAEVLLKTNKVTVAFCGEGATSQGDFHEAVNLAAVWNLPVIFIIENNGYALSTPTNEQYKCNTLADKGPGYGIDSIQLDGNNVLEVYHAVSQIAELMRSNPKPVLIEATTFRIRGHEEGSGTKYISQELLDKWKTKDPLLNYEKYLLTENVLNERIIKNFRSEFEAEIEEGINNVLKETEEYILSIEEEVNDVYAPISYLSYKPNNDTTSEKRFIDAVSDAINQSMEKDPKVMIMGQDIAEYGGVFKVTEGLLERFGKERVRNTPLCESAVVGAALGLSMLGFKIIVEIQFADFVSNAFNQIVNNLAKSYYRWGQSTNVVIRLPTGAGVQGGPFHSQSTEAWFFHVPGLKIVYPSGPYDAKGLFTSALNDPNPVLFYEHKALYRSAKESIPDELYSIEIGKAIIVSQGDAVTVVTFGMGVLWAKDVKEELNLNIEIIDLRTLSPWDKETVSLSIQKTGKALILSEDCVTGSISGEISAWISENCFHFLDSPVVRVGSLDTPVPFSKSLEDQFLPLQRFKSSILDLCNF